MIYTNLVKLSADPRTQQYIGDRLRKARDRKKLLQEEVADKTGISITYYAGIERGEENPTLAVLENLCKVLKVKSSDILPF